MTTNGDWDTDSKSRATSLLHSLCNFTFIVTFVVTYKLLSRLEGITVELQKEAIDIIQAMSLIENVKQEFREIRTNVDSYFQNTYDHIIIMAQSVGAEASMPRIAKQQIYRSNVCVETPMQHYLRNLINPFLEHIIAELDMRFSGLTRTSSQLLALVPSAVRNCMYEDLKGDVDLYEQDLPSPEVLPEEFTGWKLRFSQWEESKLPKKLHGSYKTLQ